MTNPFGAENMSEIAQDWANLIMEAKRHVREHHGRDADVEIFEPLGQHICVSAWQEGCEIHQVLYMDAALACIVSLLVSLRETNPTMTSAAVLEQFDALIAAQRHLMQTLLWEIDVHGSLDRLDPDGGIGEVQGNA